MNKKRKIKRNLIIGIFAVLASSITTFTFFDVNSKKLTFQEKQDVLSKVTLSNSGGNPAPVIGTDHLTSLPTVITKNGPIVHKGNTFYLLDWFGDIIWELDLEAELVKRGIALKGGVKGTHEFPVGSVFSNFIFNEKTNTLFILTLSTKRNGHNSVSYRDPYFYQYIIPIDVDSGQMPPIEQTNLLTKIDVGHTTGNIELKLNAQYKKIALLGNGNLVIYYLGGTSGLTNGGSNLFIYNPFTKEIKKDLLLDLYDQDWTIPNIWGWIAIPLNIIPISENRNLVILGYNRNEGQKAVGSIWAVPADGQLKPLNWWNKETSINIEYIVPISKAWDWGDIKSIQNYGYNINYYKNPITETIQFSIYNEMYFLTPDDSPRGYSYTKMELPIVKEDINNNGKIYINKGVVYSGYFDFLGDYYFNMATWVRNEWRVDPKIYRLRIQNGVPVVVTFLDLRGSGIDNIEKDVEYFKIYSILNQSGKVMLINVKSGISVAVSTEPSNINVGKILGTLNGDSSFLFRPGFNLKQTSKFLLPSELEPKDLESNSSNNILSNFKVLNIDDKRGIIQIRASINYLPWFENNNSTRFRTLEETNTFSGLRTLDASGSWLNQLPLELQNLPARFLSLKQIYESNLFSLNAKLRNIETTSGYSIVNANPQTGKVVLNYKLNYRPNLDEGGPIQSITSNSPEYEIVKETFGNNYKISLLGGSSITRTLKNNFTGNVDIANYISLKNYKESNLLPSDIAAKPQEHFINFLNREQTYGYPYFYLNSQMKADDNEGTLEVIVNIPAEVNNSLGLGTVATEIRTKYSGFNKKTTYKFDLSTFITSKSQQGSFFVDVKNLIDPNFSSKYSAKLPSKVSLLDIVKDFLNVVDFPYNDAFKIDLTPNDSSGILMVNIKLNSSYEDFKKGTIFQEFANNSVSIIFDGFKKTEKLLEEDNIIEFLKDNDPVVIKTSEKLASQITKSQATRLFSTSKTISFGGISDKNIILFPNDVTGSLTIMVDLRIGNNQTIFKDEEGLILSPIFLKTYHGFSTQQNVNYNINVLENNQLEEDIDIENLTADYIFNNISKFVSRINGYKIDNANQISIYKNEFSKTVYVNFSFQNQTGILPDIIKNFSVAYNYTPKKK